MITFFVPGVPVAKGRPRASVRKSKDGRMSVSMRTPEKTAEYEGVVAAVASDAARRAGVRYAAGEPVAMSVVLAFPPLKKDKRTGINWHVGKPDADNVIKAILDGLILSSVIADDSQVCIVIVHKVVCSPANGIGAHVAMRKLDTPPALGPVTP